MASIDDRLEEAESKVRSSSKLRLYTEFWFLFISLFVRYKLHNVFQDKPLPSDKGIDDKYNVEAAEIKANEALVRLKKKRHDSKHRNFLFFIFCFFGNFYCKQLEFTLLSLSVFVAFAYFGGCSNIRASSHCVSHSCKLFQLLLAFKFCTNTTFLCPNSSC